MQNKYNTTFVPVPILKGLLYYYRSRLIFKPKSKSQSCH